MKRSLFAGFLITAAAVLAGCSQADVQAPSAAPDTAFTADAEISYEGLELAAKVTRSAAGEWELRITEPYALEGLTMKISDGKTSLSMLGLESDSDVCTGIVSMARALACAYDAAADSALSGTSELGSYSVTLDESSLPCELSSDGLKVQFSDYRENAVEHTREL